MFPKEHGAWNALFLSLAAGWIALGEWNNAALAASFLWLSVFILRAPLSTARQYRMADPGRAQAALGFSLLLLLVSGLCAWVFWRTAPVPAFQVVLFTAVPLGGVLFFLSFWKPNLRFLFAEVLGFAGLCLAAPVLYLTGSASSGRGALLLYLLFAGYFLLALFYVRVRRDWLVRSRAGDKITPGRRSRDLGGVILGSLILALAVLFFPGGDPRLAAGPLYAGGRIFGGALWGAPGTPMMRLGFQELGHSLVYGTVTLVPWIFSCPS